MNPRFFLSIPVCIIPLLLFGQSSFTSTKLKLKGDGVRVVKIVTDNRMAPVLLVNESNEEGALTDWYIFLENGGTINLHKDDSLNRVRGHAQLGQQSAQISEMGRPGDESYRWQIATPADTLILAGFNPDNNAEFACLLYKQITQSVHSEDYTSISTTRKNLIPLLKFSTIRSRKNHLGIFETGQLSDYPYLAKIVGAFLATLKYSDRI